MELYNLGKDIVAFTTDRIQGRDMCKIGETLVSHFPHLQGKIRNGLYPHQTHTDKVYHITAEFMALPEEERKNRLEGIDAIISDVPDVIMGISTADCIPVLVYDPEHHAAGVVHSGWRGTAANITEAAVASMVRSYHSKPESLLAVIGPGISCRNFEVGDEVYDAFASAGYPMNIIAVREEKWHIDLPKCCRLQLEAVGIPSANIRMTDICTYDQTDDYFSARKLGIESGRILTGIILR